MYNIVEFLTNGRHVSIDKLQSLSMKASPSQEQSKSIRSDSSLRSVTSRPNVWNWPSSDVHWHRWNWFFNFKNKSQSWLQNFYNVFSFHSCHCGLNNHQAIRTISKQTPAVSRESRKTIAKKRAEKMRINYTLQNEQVLSCAIMLLYVWCKDYSLQDDSRPQSNQLDDALDESQGIELYEWTKELSFEELIK